MLDRARDTGGDVQIRRDGLTRLTDLMSVRYITGIYCRATRADGFGSLSYRRVPQGLVVTDRRPGLPAFEYRFDEIETAVYLACEDGATFEDIDAALRIADLGTVRREDLNAFLDELTAARLVYRDGTRYLGLALPRGNRADGSGRVTAR